MIGENIEQNVEQNNKQSELLVQQNEETTESVEEPQVFSQEDEDENYQAESESESESESQVSQTESQEGGVNIDLSDNDFYKGLCTLLEDEGGNNILEYISLLHTELIGVNKNLRAMNKNMGVIAKCADIMTKKN